MKRNKSSVITLSIENNLLDRVESERGRVTRSRFITDILQESFAKVV